MFDRKLTCFHCTFERETPQVGDVVYIDFKFLVHNSSNIHEFTCPLGHFNRYWIQALPFEIQIMLSADALITADYDAAVLRMHAALEQHHEFLAEFILSKSGLSRPDFLSTLEKIGPLSERRLGFCMGIESMSPHLIGSEIAVSFSKNKRQDLSHLRNKVAHQAYLPSKSEAEEFCQTIYDAIIATTLTCRNMDPDQVLFLIARRAVEASQESFEEGIQLITRSFNGPLSAVNQMSFSELCQSSLLARVQHHREVTLGPFRQQA